MGHDQEDVFRRVSANGVIQVSVVSSARVRAIRSVREEEVIRHSSAASRSANAATQHAALQGSVRANGLALRNLPSDDITLYVRVVYTRIDCEANRIHLFLHAMASRSGFVRHFHVFRWCSVSYFLIASGSLL